MRLCLTLLVTILGTAWPALADPDGTTVNSQVAKQLDERFAELAQKGFSGVVLVGQDGKVVFAKGYGFANRRDMVPWTPATVFDIGSITKPFTAAAILKLEMEGKLQVSDTLAKFFNDVPDDKKAISIHHLLTHTSGLPDSIGGDYDPIGRDEFVKLAWASKIRTPPGESYFYSNVGYSLLGAIIERISGQEYDAYLHDNLFAPAGMSKTGYRIPNWKVNELAHGYRKDNDWGTPLDHAWADKGPYWNLRANGGLLSTVGDLFQWTEGLKDDEKILSKEAKARMFHPHAREGVGANSHYYGYGWSISKTRDNTKVYEHNGSNGVFFADLRIYPERDTVLILATNSSGLRYMSELGNVARLLGSKVQR